MKMAGKHLPKRPGCFNSFDKKENRREIRKTTDFEKLNRYRGQSQFVSTLAFTSIQFN